MSLEFGCPSNPKSWRCCDESLSHIVAGDSAAVPSAPDDTTPVSWHAEARLTSKLTTRLRPSELGGNLVWTSHCLCSIQLHHRSHQGRSMVLCELLSSRRLFFAHFHTFLPASEVRFDDVSTTTTARIIPTGAKSTRHPIRISLACFSQCHSWRLGR